MHVDTDMLVKSAALVEMLVILSSHHCQGPWLLVMKQMIGREVSEYDDDAINE